MRSAGASAPLTPPTADAALADRGFYMEADTVVRDDKANSWLATGQVEARYQGRTLRANEVTYNAQSGEVTATGNVQILNADGTSEFADSIVLDKNFSAGVALGFSTRQLQNVKLTSAAAIRRSPDSLELNRAVFTPCDCEDPKTGQVKEPTWSIRASRVVQDKKKQLVYYRNAVIQVLGVPVLYAPVFWHPDPTAERKSGLLIPKLDYTKRRGFTYEQPYLWVINPSTDLVVSPQLNTKVNPFLNTEYRQRFWSGQMEFRAGVGYDQDFTSKSGKFGDETTRSYILGEGAFKPDKRWTLGFSAERVSDDLLFRRYDVGRVYEARGLYLTDDQRLISQAYAVRQDANSFVSVAAFSIQGLRLGDDDGAFPTVAPLVEFRYQPESQIFGGRLRLTGGAVALTRDEDDGNTVTGRTRNPDLPGVDVARVSFGADWRRAYTTGRGIRIEPFADARGDVYHIKDRLPVDGPNGTVTRGGATVGVDVSWPFIRTGDDYTVILEPIAQVALSPETQSLSDIPNEDSIVFDFDETNLFQANKSPGFDLYEGGQRLNVGGRATVSWGEVSQLRLIAGRSFRASRDDVLPARTSLRETSSDWVGAAFLTIGQNLTAYARTRLDDQYEVRRGEVGLNLSTDRVVAFTRYLVDELDISGSRREDFQAYLAVNVTKNWGVLASANLDMEADVWVRQEFGVFYEDECTRLDVVWERDGTYDRTFTPSSKISVRLTLATLGQSGYDDAADFR
jgi:LPS-assembly protein